ncbi:MAG: PIG-L deacetylase family protein [Acetobacteraceae bacterium]|nr:PIG-L deacetylase family protein [Acetobacteraceae bacterium]
MRTALFVSPHLDDVVFSCGGTLAAMADAGWRTVMATCFTATVERPTGFALACQLDKGLGAEVDYMALRRAEDQQAADLLGVETVRWLDLQEAPHRGYESAPALFGDLRDDDDVWRPLAARLRILIEATEPERIFAPQGLGGHVDHRQTIRAVQEVAGGIPTAWYRDTPYAIRNPAATAFVAAPGPVIVPIQATIDHKIAAACAYKSQIGFQFGGAAGVETALRAFADREGGERFIGMLDVSAFSTQSSHSQATMSRFKGEV